MQIKSFFKYCPQCKADTLCFEDNKHFICRNCSWEYYHNAAAAAGAVLFYQDKILMIIRRQEPGKGKLDIPGGFVDPGESAEEACKREIKEELGIELKQLHYFQSYSNQYPYKGIQYATCDIIFWSLIEHKPEKLCALEVEEIYFLNPYEIDLNQLAFISKKKLIADICRKNPIKK